MTEPTTSHDPAAACSFCRRPREEVGRLITARADVSICDACVVLCQQVLAEAGEATAPGEHVLLELPVARVAARSWRSWFRKVF